MRKWPGCYYSNTPWSKFILLGFLMSQFIYTNIITLMYENRYRWCIWSNKFSDKKLHFKVSWLILHNLCGIICYCQISVSNRHWPLIGLHSHIKIKVFSISWGQKWPTTAEILEGKFGVTMLAYHRERVKPPKIVLCSSCDGVPLKFKKKNGHAYSLPAQVIELSIKSS
jgi:hypothetical protein